MDSQLSKLFDFTKADERLRNSTLIIVYSDNTPKRARAKPALSVDSRDSCWKVAFDRP